MNNGIFDDVSPKGAYTNKIVQDSIQQVIDTIWWERMQGADYYVYL